MIDRTDGSVTLNHQFSISSELDLEEFSQLPEFNHWKAVKPFVYAKDYFLEQASRVSVWIMFDVSTQHISRCEISLHSENDEAKEKLFLSQAWHHFFLQRKQQHNEFLKSELGDKPYNFSWGWITVGTNEIGNDVAIKIRYFDHMEPETSSKSHPFFNINRIGGTLNKPENDSES
jgi:hypothetical protein